MRVVRLLTRPLLLSFLTVFTNTSWAQSVFSEPLGDENEWYLADPESDSVQGISIEKAYREFLVSRSSRTVVVAVIDSGVDINHEDLKDVIWVNEGEIAGNGLDDDHNGYVDDVHGWNFIGGKAGNVNEDTYELTREYARLKPVYESKEGKRISKKERKEYEYWKLIENRYLKYKEKSEKDSKECDEQLAIYKSFGETLNNSLQTLKDAYQIEVVGRETVDTITSKDRKIQFAKYIVGVLLQNASGDESLTEMVDELNYVIHHNSDVCDHYKVAIEKGYSLDYDTRQIVGDNYGDVSERYYGNNDIIGPDAFHGTHVAGIIAADRNNSLGIKGIADNVRIMAIRAVPNGDERDKDVANAILYAVDNGAQIINMSFGKDYSPQKSAVDKAVEYAESKGVLLVHAAGNDHTNIDQEPSYPSRYYASGKEARNWIEVGASSSGEGNELVGKFSNYGKKSVDVFAPGVSIYSTKPNNAYENADGTSMASPIVAGIAATLMQYFPTLTALEVKDIILTSSRKFDSLKVTKPGSSDKVRMDDLCNTGGVVNAYEAIKLAILRSSTKVE